MRKLIFACTMLAFSQFSFGQAIQDNATIPVSVTLNSILRLTVTTGGNIQFVFNTMDQYANGIINTAGTTTTFQVASSRDFAVTIGAEDDNLYGVEDVANTLPLATLEYTLSTSGTRAGTLTPAAGTYVALTQVPGSTIVTSLAGGAAENIFSVEWRAGVGTPVLDGVADVYVTNVFLNLQPQ